eukprot:CAMPEP_0167830790 /NCGR_PEP_ID=MMETSP0112_2-20121227/13182_1 /TAXON_ID=91324 /ORGANISM="Lotharella globosa, Strain CCCM811" /LENGTH=32 /DNA_ID= /DNA_START= /DNA_END= /DNA_ORIENTATION=
MTTNARKQGVPMMNFRRSHGRTRDLGRAIGIA